MTCTVIVGGFFGDEGKGKIASYMAVKDKIDVAVRTGSVNAGHTVVWEKRKYKLRIIPSAFIYEKCRLLIGAGANLNVSIFLKEVKETESEKRVGVDFKTSIIEEKHVREDRGDEHLAKKIATTGQGVGPAIAERVRRKAKLAMDIEELKPYLTEVALEVNQALDLGKGVLIEGTQGTYLSLYHGTYPYVTGRDTTASAICSEVGIGPKRIDDVLIVFKSYITRVGTGPLPNELSPEEADKRGWTEIATVTGRRRRVAPFNFQLAKKAIIINSATQIALTKLDIVYPECKGVRSYNELSTRAKKFVEEIEDKLGIPATLIGTGESVYDVIDLRGEKLEKQ